MVQGITPELFFKACQVSRTTRDVNISVFDRCVLRVEVYLAELVSSHSTRRLVAIDDFQTFKKIMVKRNVELQLEALRSFRVGPGADFGGEYDDEGGGVAAGDADAQLGDAYLEMRLLHAQEQLEQDELAVAMAMSLADDGAADSKSSYRRGGAAAHKRDSLADGLVPLSSGSRSASRSPEAKDAVRKSSFLLHADAEHRVSLTFKTELP